MNKRIKCKHAVKENKNMMDSTLKYLRDLGLTPFNVEYPKGYFVFENKHSFEMMHFQLKELPEFLFGVWYKEFNLYASPNDENVLEVVKLPVIFGERLCILDKFKPSRAEWSPLYNQYIDKGQRFELTDYYATLRSLKDFVKAPWNYIPYETEEEFQRLREYFKLKAQYTEEVLQKLYTKVEEKFKELEVPLGILSHDSFWSHQNLYLIFEDGTSQEQVDSTFEKLHEYVQFDLTEDVKELSRPAPYTEYVSIFSSEFDWHLDYYWWSTKDTIERAKMMSFMELNKHFNDLNLKGSDFVRLIRK